MNNDHKITFPSYKISRWVIRRLVHAAAKNGLYARTLIANDDESIRWLKPEISEFLVKLDYEADRLRVHARIDKLPSLGNRILVELAVYTTASDRTLRALGVSPSNSRQVVADIGWDVYRRLLLLTVFPVRLITRDPGKRLRATIRMLLRFPFNAKNPSGYLVESWIDGEDIHTHFTNCPPHNFVRAATEADNDPDILKGFQESWCQYDWAGADVVAGDGARGHYVRRQTLSFGDPVCDMCWAARAQQ